MNKYYVITSTTGRCNCRRTSCRIWETKKNKTQIRKFYVGTGTRVEHIYTEADLMKLDDVCREHILKEAF